METVEKESDDFGDFGDAPQKNASPPKEPVQEDAFGDFDEPAAKEEAPQENEDDWGTDFQEAPAADEKKEEESAEQA